MKMAHFNKLAILTFTILTLRATNTVLAETAKKSDDDGTTRSCITRCRSDKDCNCTAASNRDTTVAFCNIPRGKTDGLCSYCLKNLKICSKTNSTANQTFACCDEVGHKYSKEEPMQDVTCRLTSNRKQLKCLHVCSDFASKQTCYDKDGYLLRSRYLRCKGSYKNSLVDCDRTECSSAGGPCDDGKHKCCDSGDFIIDDRAYLCVNGKCKRNCMDLDSACTSDNFKCCARKEIISCSASKFTGKGKCEVFTKYQLVDKSG